MPDFAARLSALFSVPRGSASGSRGLTFLVRALTLVAILLTVGFLIVQGGHLWREWQMLQREVRTSQLQAPVGYLNIAPISSYAEAPREWFRDNGKALVLWSRWESGVGHQWYRFASGELDRHHIARPNRLFISRPVDYPLVESSPGPIWNRLPSESMVVAFTLEGQECAYPTGVLRKVEVINDVVEGHPYLVSVNPFVAESDGYSIYDASLDGHRVTMAATGYFYDGKQPILCDRGTDSFWSDLDGALTSVAGKNRGRQLRRVAHPAPVTWASWLSRKSKGRLLVGADRSQGVPKE
jgi:hypothetical protein